MQDDKLIEVRYNGNGFEVGKYLNKDTYSWIPVVRVANVTLDGSTLTVRASELGHFQDWMDFDTDTEYKISFEYMKKSDFESLPEFDGF